MPNTYIKGILIAIFGAVLYSTKAIFVKLTYAQTTIDSVTLLTLRMLFASPFYWLSILRLKQMNIPQKNKKLLLKAGFTTGVLFYLSALFDFIGLRYISASMERLVLFIYPSLVLLFSAFFFKQSIKKYQWQALILTYLGISLAFVFEMQQQFSNTLLIGAGFVALSSITYAFFIIVNGKVLNIFGSERFTNHTMLWAVFCIVLHYMLTQNVMQLFSFSLHTYLLIMAMALFSTVIPSYLMTVGIRRIGSSNAAVVNSIGPVSTIIQAAVFLGEQIAFAQIIGTLLVLIGIWLIGKK